MRHLVVLMLGILCFCSSVQADISAVMRLDPCENTNLWKTSLPGQSPFDLQPYALDRKEGERCLRAVFDPGHGGTAYAEFNPNSGWGNHTYLTFWLKAEGQKKSDWSLRITADSTDGVFTIDKRIDLNFDGWTKVRLRKDDFAFYMRKYDQSVDWSKITSYGFGLMDGSDKPTIYIDDICYEDAGEPSVNSAVRTGPDPRFWWWDGGYDQYCAMHAIYADWPHLASDKERHAALEFSEFILSPLVPYKVYIDNDGGYSKLRLSITDWKLNPVKVVDIVEPKGKTIEVSLVAPARAGTFIFNLERYKGSGEPEKYQTGIMVLAKRLAEPKGIWGIHGYIGQKGQSWPHHDVVLRMFQATGITCLRERFCLPATMYTSDPLSTPAGNVCRLAKDRSIEVDATVSVLDPKYFMDGDYAGKGLKPEMREEFARDIEEVTRTWKGLVNWYEYGNEPNDRPLGPYADAQKIAYAAAKKGDPNCRFVMGGAHVIDRWQYQLWEKEKQTGVPYQDALATHLYPDIGSIESTMRSWITGLGPALKEKGMIMTESGWETFKPQAVSLVKNGTAPPEPSGEHQSQIYYALFSPLILGECMKMNSNLYGVYYFQAMSAMGDNLFNRWEELYVWSTGQFVGKWNTREITMARPMVYTHNTVARLLTHEVKPASVSVIWDKTEGNVDYYAFRRPGETIVPIWIGMRAGTRADKLQATVELPKSCKLVLAADMDGNERVLSYSGGFVKLELTRDNPVYLRFLDGSRVGKVFAQGMKDLPAKGFRVVKGTPEKNPEIVEHVSRDRNLPAINNVVPAVGAPMALYSKQNNTVYLIGRTEKDVALAAKAFRTAGKRR